MVNAAATPTQVDIMKALVQAVLVSCALAAPALSFAQAVNNGPVTRAEVRADLARVERAGYRPEASDPYYPADIQAAEAKVAATQDVDRTAVGGVAMTGATQSGGPAHTGGSVTGKSIYFGH
jgi:hypothetical protein